MKCQQCDVETYMPFKCPYCGQHFCVQHRLPENHTCPEYWRAKAPRDQPGVTVGATRSGNSYQHQVSLMPPRKGNRVIWFSITELKHLLAGMLLTLAIGFSMPLYWRPELYGVPEVLTALAVVFASSFVIHELAHKITAQQHGLWAEFRITVSGALITLLSVISPFKIISPGAVMIRGVADKKVIGITSIAGPTSNIVLTMVFVVLAQVSQGPIASIFEFGMLINSFIALFNLIPFGILDGFKVFSWNKGIWAMAFSASLALTIYSYLA